MTPRKVVEPTNRRQQFMLPVISLFASGGTLICCALPALMVSIGAGASLAGLVSTAPWLVAFSKYKVWTFTLSALLIVFAGVLRYQARSAPCPLDSRQADACARLKSISGLIYWFSVIIWLTGFFFAFIAVRLL